MSVKEDRDEFNNSGLRGLLHRVMKDRDEAFIKETAEGWQGEVVAERPLPGSGPYLHYKRGDGVWRYSNSSSEDKAVTPYRVWL